MTGVADHGIMSAGRLKATCVSYRVTRGSNRFNDHNQRLFPRLTRITKDILFVKHGKPGMIIGR